MRYGRKRIAGFFPSCWTASFLPSTANWISWISVLSNLERQLNTLSGTTGEIHQDTSRMKEQLDILYGWVDEMELRIKALEQLT